MTVISSSWRPSTRAAFRVVNFRDVADLEEVIARTKVPSCSRPRCHAVRDFRGIGACDAAVLLDVREVGLAAVAVLDSPARAALHHAAQFVHGYGQRTRGADTGGHVAEELVHEFAQPRLDLLACEPRRHQSHAAIDVVADTAGRDDSLIHVPSSVWLLLMIVSATVCWCTGYATGVSAGERLGMSLLLLPLLVTIMSTIVADLDRPRHGLITISEESMHQCKPCWKRIASSLSDLR